MKKISLAVLALLLTAAPAHANKKIFTKIGENAKVANGSWEVTTYNKSLSEKELKAQGLKELEKEYWKDCGPWETFTSRREVIKQIAKWDEGDPKSKAEKLLDQLYDDEKIVAAVGATSNGEVECSVRWFNIYGADGSKLELRFNQGD